MGTDGPAGALHTRSGDRPVKPPRATSRLPAPARHMITGLDGLDWLVVLLILALIVHVILVLAPALVLPGVVASIMDVVRAMIGPVNLLLEDGIRDAGFPVKWHRVPLAPVLFVIILFLVRAMIFYIQERIEKIHRRTLSLREAEELIAADRQAASRRVAVRTYADAQAVLQSSRIELTFLSLDIVGSTKMKLGEDSVLVEQAFADYMKMVRQVLQKNNAYKTTWTPDGQMAAFKSPDDGVLAGQEVLSSLVSFNRGISRMKTAFRLRAGAHIGTVSTDDETPMEKISDFSIDVAGHLQKKAPADSLWISERLYERLEHRELFEDSGEIVDEFRAFAWRPGASS